MTITPPDLGHTSSDLLKPPLEPHELTTAELRALGVAAELLDQKYRPTPGTSAIDEVHRPTSEEIQDFWEDTPERAEQIAHAHNVIKKAHDLHTANFAETIATLRRDGVVSPDEQ